MKQITEQRDVCNEFPEKQKRELLLASLRRSSAGLRSSAYELDEIGLALKFNMIDAEAAVSWLDYIGAIHILNAEPWTNRVEVAA